MKAPVLLLIAALLPLAACQAPAPVEPFTYVSPLRADHSLVGRIWDNRLQRFVAPEQVLAALNSARYVLLGEKHDNVDHHRLQSRLLQSLIADGALSGVALEMIDASRAPQLDGIAQREFAGDEELRQWLDWDEGWTWEFYAPLLRAALNAGLPLAAANIAQDAIAEIYQGADAGLPANVLDAAATGKLHADIDQSHCGLLPESQFPAMARVQQARDLAMAKALRSLANEGGAALLVAGNYHVRQDLGVPNYLLALDAGLSRVEIVALAFLEVREDELVPTDYLERFGGIAEYDYLWFTPAVEEQDYCASLL